MTPVPSLSLDLSALPQIAAMSKLLRDADSLKCMCTLNAHAFG